MNIQINDLLILAGVDKKTANAVKSAIKKETLFSTLDCIEQPIVTAISETYYYNLSSDGLNKSNYIEDLTKMIDALTAIKEHVENATD